MDEYYRAIRLLPSWLAGPLGQLPAQTAAQSHELRFRTGWGAFVTLSGRQLPLQDLPECPLGDLERRLAQTEGFTVTEHVVQLYGYCRACEEKRRKKENASGHKDENPS